MPIGAIAGIGSALLGASSASKAAKAQSKAADQQLQLQKDMYDQTREDLGGYRDAGDIALQAYLYEMGLGPMPTVGGTSTLPAIETVTTPGTAGSPAMGHTVLGGLYGQTGHLMTGNSDTRDAIRGTTGGQQGSTQYRVNGQLFNTLEEAQEFARANATTTGGAPYGGFKETPSYQFRLQQGQDSINALAGARGGLHSGATLKALTDYNQGLASEEYGNFLSRLAGLTDMGASAASGQAGANNAFAQMGSSAISQKGNAASAGAIGVNNALQQGLQTGVNLWGYQQGLQQRAG
ncbi:hypothetical protein [uncultured Paracoccus sp.]|uniref:hypothetical protein n=1 Tax=uncultured Paracoccus sp. TaxID=189685 RepID=UPI00259AA38E|nr:hypothetical protein [uncultured Paracoccus sp.]